MAWEAEVRARAGLAGVIVILSGLVATCAYNPPPAPIAGDADTIGFLAGEWTGTYESEDTGRVGDIYFRLRAGADTARGEVLMASRPNVASTFREPTEFEEAPPTRAPPVVTINFIQTGGPWVYGALDEYRDPESGDMLNTTFTGRIDGDRIRGQFKSSPVGGAVTAVGSWAVRRTGPPPRDPPAIGPDMPVAALADTAGLPGVQGPTEEQLIAMGGQLFRELGCSFCHGPEGRGRMAPDLAEALPHRDFSWIYRMILSPDSMVRNDPAAKQMYEQFDLKMPDRAVSPWEALALYEYLFAEIVKEEPPF